MIFFWKYQISAYKWTSVTLTLFLGGLGLDVAFHSSLASVFCLVMTKFLNFINLALSSWQMQTGFVSDFGCQSHIFQFRTVKLLLQHPNIHENKMQLTPGL
jgi:hypothetical protein